MRDWTMMKDQREEERRETCLRFDVAFPLRNVPAACWTVLPSTPSHVCPTDAVMQAYVAWSLNARPVFNSRRMLLVLREQ